MRAFVNHTIDRIEDVQKNLNRISQELDRQMYREMSLEALTEEREYLVRKLKMVDSRIHEIQC